MRLTKVLYFFAGLVFVTFASCDKKEQLQEPNCTDNVLNNGETSVDCGGPCAPCPEFQNPLFFGVFDGQIINFSNVSVNYGDTVFIHASVDSVQLNLAFKNLTIPDASGQLFPLVATSQPLVTYNNTDYALFDPGYSVVVLTETDNSKISGLFQLALPHGFNNMDTLRVINGTFENIPY